MSNQWMAVLVGGLIPAVVYGLAGVMQKTASKSGIGTGPYVLFISIGFLIAGFILCFLDADREINLKSGVLSVIVGVLCGLGMGLVGYALSSYGANISILTPLYNMNTLIAVVLAIFIYSEWKEVNTLKIMAGAIMIVIGGALVATK